MSIDTIPAQFLHSVEKYNNPQAFRFKKDGRWIDVSHQEAFQKAYNSAIALQALNLARGDRIAILSENRYEWVVADQAILAAGCIDVPVYATLPSGQVEYILHNSESRAIFVSSAEQLAKIRECRKNLPMLQHVICFDAECAASDVISLDDLIARGAAVENKPSYSDLIRTIGKYDWASILYTSGTTGNPKGVILTHWNFMSNVRSCLDALKMGSDDACLSFLPLSHSIERMAGYYVMIAAGVTIAYAESIETVADNMREVSPTVMCSVPRLYEKMYARILDAVEKGSVVKRGLFSWAIKAGSKYVSETLSGGAGAFTRSKRNLAAKLVFSKLKARTGGRLRFFVSGGAPLSQEIAEFFYAAGLPILEGYGLTETAPVLSVNTFDNFKFGTVGKPVSGVEIRIAEDGEILARGENIMQGYYKNPEATAEVLKDGWFYTGDIGHLDQDGFVVITDRKKDIIVTAGGKNVAPQPIENALKNSAYIAEAVIIGDRRPYCAVLIVPAFEKLDDFAAARSIPNSTRAELLANPTVQQLYQGELDTVCASLAKYEQPHKFSLIDRELTVDDGELTPSLKVKRRIVEQKYQKLIDAMYTS